MKKFTWTIFLLIFTVGFGLAFTPAQAADKVVTVRVTGHMPVGHYDTVACEKFIKEAEERSKGTLKFTHYPAGQLAMDMKAFDLCRRGGIEMAQFFTNRAVGHVPETDLTIPYFDEPNWFSRRMFDEASGGGLFQKFIVPKFHKLGLHLMLGPLYSPEHSMITKKEVRKMSDYGGLKIRVSGRSYGHMIESWGGKPVVMTSADVYMALQRGTLDGANSGLTTFRSRKWFEVMSHVQLLWQQVSSLDMIANLKWWNSLSAEHKKVIEESLRSATIWGWDHAINDVEKDIKFLKDKGLKVFDFRAEAPEEWEKIRQANLKAQEREVGKIVGKAVWKEHMRMMNDTKDGKKTWKEVLQTMKW